MITDEQLKVEGLKALTEALGDVQAEKFIALVMRSRFDYTKWQRKLWVEKSVEEISDAAMKLRKSKDGDG
ncbi:hypothetical protein F4054_10550 [Candidatus Poribacteria bacterium]|nr:hypothetical protein [Candidatus Poribacteria bacterium]MYG07074.1 hypothetical protein [Candidatus Poribacteria bacterium]MYK22686.1 hypothetical protein [Candidatus Poribacteria bacterium]